MSLDCELDYLAPLVVYTCPCIVWNLHITLLYRSTECSKAFQNAKNQLSSACILTHYNPNLPIILEATYGVGVVISHIFSDSSERLITFASHTLTSAKKNCAQLEKKALALIFGVKKFYH